MVDGEALVTTMATISSQSTSRQSVRTGILSLELEFWMAAELGSVSGKFLGGSSLLGQEQIYRRRGTAQERVRPQGAGPPAAPGVVWGLWAPHRPPSGSGGLLAQKFMLYFFWNFSDTFISAQK